jgi:Xaa-Pro aminopeptidase
MTPRSIPAAEVLRARRQALAARLSSDGALFVGHRLQPRNYLANAQPFRQDSSFLFFFGLAAPDVAGVIDPDGTSVLYAPRSTPEDALWHGEVPGWDVLAALTGVEEVRDMKDLGPGPLRGLPVAEPGGLERASRILGRPLDPRDPAAADPELADCVIGLRLRRDGWDIAQMETLVPVTARAHRAAMAATRPGVTEHEIRAAVEREFLREGCASAYPSIVTARGEVLHGHDTDRRLAAGDLVLVDAGVEGACGLATDVTRTWPVSGTWEGRARAAYEAVLAANEAAIAAVRPGARYRDLHVLACRVLCQALRDWGLLRGEVDGLVERGAHAIFFPHGLGHLLGYDVHDLELFGDRAGYAPGRSRSTQFGLRWLRLDRDLEPGLVVTIEPGLYFAPAIIQHPELRTTFRDDVAWEEAERWLGLGGIRIEDDVLVTRDGARVLTAEIPKAPDAVAALVGVDP